MINARTLFTVGCILLLTTAEQTQNYQMMADLANEAYYPTHSNGGKRARRDVGDYKLRTRGCPADAHHATFVNANTKEVVLALRGVVMGNMADMMGPGLALLSNELAQHPRARELERAVKSAMKVIRTELPGFTLKLTGHSLGGSLAMLAAAENMLDASRGDAAYTFNACGGGEWFYAAALQAPTPVYTSFWRGDSLSASLLSMLETIPRAQVKGGTINIEAARVAEPHGIVNFCSQDTQEQEAASKREQQGAHTSRSDGEFPIDDLVAGLGLLFAGGDQRVGGMERKAYSPVRSCASGMERDFIIPSARMVPCH